MYVFGVVVLTCFKQVGEDERESEDDNVRPVTRSMPVKKKSSVDESAWKSSTLRRPDAVEHY